MHKHIMLLQLYYKMGPLISNTKIQISRKKDYYNHIVREKYKSSDKNNDFP